MGPVAAGVMLVGSAVVGALSYSQRRRYEEAEEEMRREERRRRERREEHEAEVRRIQREHDAEVLRIQREHDAEVRRIQREERQEAEARRQAAAEQRRIQSAQQEAARRQREAEQRRIESAQQEAARRQRELEQARLREERQRQAAREAQRALQKAVESYQTQEEQMFQKHLELVRMLPDPPRGEKKSAAFMGRTSAGKSTLINSLFGTSCKVSPVACTTGVQVVYSDASLDVCDVFGHNDAESYHNAETLMLAKTLHIVVVVYNNCIEDCLKLARLIAAMRVDAVFFRNSFSNLTPREKAQVYAHEEPQIRATCPSFTLLVGNAKTGEGLEDLRAVLYPHGAPPRGSTAAPMTFAPKLRIDGPQMATRNPLDDFSKGSAQLFQNHLKLVEQLADGQKTGKLKVAFMGRTSAGKSTLINTLYGANCAVSPLACTRGFRAVYSDHIEAYDVFGQNDVESYHHVKTLMQAKGLDLIVVVYNNCVEDCQHLALLTKALRVKTVFFRNLFQDLSSAELTDIRMVEGRKLRAISPDAKLYIGNAKTGSGLEDLGKQTVSRYC